VLIFDDRLEALDTNSIPTYATQASLSRSPDS
jgi:hypothetical protein